MAQKHLLQQGYEVYLPLLARWVRHSRNWSLSHSALFPRYAFVRPGHEQQSLFPVRSTPGVSNLVRFGPQLALLGEAQMAALRHAMQLAEEAIPEQPLSAGMKVQFQQGPLKGLVGLVSSVAEERVMVLFTLLGQDQVAATTAADLALA